MHIDEQTEDTNEDHVTLCALHVITKLRFFPEKLVPLTHRFNLPQFTRSRQLFSSLRNMRCSNRVFDKRRISSFIHSGYLHSAPSRNILRVALSPATAKEK